MKTTSSRPLWIKLAVIGAVALLAIAAGMFLPRAPGAKGVPPPLGTLPKILKQASGLMASRRAPNVLYSHNDHGDEPLLYALDTNASLLGTIRITGVTNGDWEDVASFELDGQPWLLIGDVGDNLSNREDRALYIVPEPDPATLSPAREISVAPAWRVPVRFPDGAHDCEAVAVDAREGKVYLLTKRAIPSALYSLPLRPPPGGATPMATLVLRLTQIPHPDGEEQALHNPTSAYAAQVTAMDIAPDGLSALVLTHGNVWLFPRRADQSWPEAFAAVPTQLLPPLNLPQAEAACFSRDGREIFVTGEGKKQPLLRYPLPAK